LPEWIEPALRRAPWVVVRRGHVQAGRVPVGVRGSTRSQRFAAWLAISEIAERLSPEDLIGLPRTVGQTRKDRVPALAALDRIAPLLARHSYRWGPGGSVGFELATGAAAATPSSDLDVILRQPHRLPPHEALTLRSALQEAAAPARIDVLLETPQGGVSLADLAVAPKQVLLRTPNGPRLAADPWLVEGAS
jgi:phosphoribosyl-dephospho-CoA transferase